MAKSRIGPFALEAPLAPPTQAGQMFRGIHVEQRKLAALRVFAIPLGMTPESRQGFATEVEELKQLRHPGIVRCYGGGFEPRKAFLAYELVDGESLDKLIERRERLPWETALDFARQLGEALQYAHSLNWSHGRLQPSKILIVSDGTVKIADWRRDEIGSILSSPPSLEQIHMSAPEVLDGQNADDKSDLYSLGCVMYVMLTGNSPLANTSFRAVLSDHAAPGRPLSDLGREDLIHRIHTETPPSANATVFDCPVWLSAIVDQLLAKSPKQRPFGFAAFLAALSEAHRRQSQGVGVLQHAAAGFSPLQLNVDRKEAEKVLGIKREDKPRSESSIWESTWLLLTGLALAVAAVVWFLLPPSEESLYQRAEQLLASENWTDWNQARDEALLALVERFPDGKYREWADDKIAWTNAREAERRMQRDERLGRKDDWTEPQIQYAEAQQYERFGDFVSALEKYRAIRTLFSGQQDATPILYLASEGVERIRQSKNQNSLQGLLQAKMDVADKAVKSGQQPMAKLTWEAIVELYEGNEQVASIVERAKLRLAELK